MKKILEQLFSHQSLSREEAHEVMTQIAEGKANDSEIASFISVFLMRSIELEELIGFREALLQMAVPINLSNYDAVDIVGTGGDGKNTFNISTCAAFVVAGLGYKVAKHGNYGSTSVSGSSNVLEYFGAKLTNNTAIVRQSIEEANLAYLHAPLWNPAMKNVAKVRKELGIRTFFNVLGPLINPAQPAKQCLGTFDLKMMRLYKYIYQRLDVQFTIVHSLDGYDELSLTAPAQLTNNNGETLCSPQDFGFDPISQADIYGGNSIAEAADIFINVLQNKSTMAQKNVVIANAALVIATIKPEQPIEECIQEAKTSIESGNAYRSFKRFLDIYA